MKHRGFALSCAACLALTGAAAAMPMPVPAQAAVDPVIGELPEWVPQDFAGAMQFYNTHGKSYVADNVICLVRPMLHFKKDDYGFSYSGSMTTVNTPAGSTPKIYELEIPEKPDPTDEEAVRAYEEYCDSLGIYSHDYSFFESYAGCKTQYAFEVELFRVLDGLDLTVAWYEKDGDTKRTTEKFSFANKNGTTVETDIYSWLPDSEPEFNAFQTQYGKASVHDNYIVYCSDVNASTGASLKMQQSGEGTIKEVRRSTCAPFELLPQDGSASADVILYQPTADGTVNVKWTVGREWSEEEPYEWTDGIYEIKDHCSVILDLSPNRKGTTVFTFIDKETGSPIEIPADNSRNIYLLKSTTGDDPSTGEIYPITSNPCTVDSIHAYDPDCSYSFNYDSKAGWYSTPEFAVTSEESDCVAVTCKMKWMPSGDANGDGATDAADVKLLQTWLLGEANLTFADWNAVDFCRDGRLNASDLCMMKQDLLRNNQNSYVEPDHLTTFGVPFWTLEECRLYLGPDTSYPAVTSVPADARMKELGYQENNSQWMFTEYKGTKGWIRIVREDGVTPTIDFEVAVDKPVIYLYPEETTDVHVELELTESELSTTYPKYQNGWDVTASPDGSLLNKADGTHHRYLFWDSVNCRTRFDFSRGFCVAGSDTEQFLKEKLTFMGLTENEMNEFIVYWLPRMEHNAYNLITFQGDAYTNSAKLNITPAPDSICRVFMAYVPLEDAVEIEPQQLHSFARTGFAVVEWGGSEIKS